MSNKTLICILQLWVLKYSYEYLNTYYGKENKGPFLLLKKSLTSPCALYSFLQLRLIFVYIFFKKFNGSEICSLSDTDSRMAPGWRGDPVKVLNPWVNVEVYDYGQMSLKE